MSLPELATLVVVVPVLAVTILTARDLRRRE